MPGGASRARPVGSGPAAKLEQASASVLVPEPSACGLRAGEPPTLDPASPSRPTQPGRRELSFYQANSVPGTRAAARISRSAQFRMTVRIWSRCAEVMEL